MNINWDDDPFASPPAERQGRGASGSRDRDGMRTPPPSGRKVRTPDAPRLRNRGRRRAPLVTRVSVPDLPESALPPWPLDSASNAAPGASPVKPDDGETVQNTGATSSGSWPSPPSFGPTPPQAPRPKRTAQKEDGSESSGAELSPHSDLQRFLAKNRGETYDPTAHPELIIPPLPQMHPSPSGSPSISRLPRPRPSPPISPPLEASPCCRKLAFHPGHSDGDDEAESDSGTDGFFSSCHASIGSPAISPASSVHGRDFVDDNFFDSILPPPGTHIDTTGPRGTTRQRPGSATASGSEEFVSPSPRRPRYQYEEQRRQPPMTGRTRSLSTDADDAQSFTTAISPGVTPHASFVTPHFRPDPTPCQAADMNNIRLDESADFTYMQMTGFDDDDDEVRQASPAFLPSCSPSPPPQINVAPAARSDPIMEPSPRTLSEITRGFGNFEPIYRNPNPRTVDDDDLSEDDVFPSIPLIDTPLHSSHKPGKYFQQQTEHFGDLQLSPTPRGRFLTASRTRPSPAFQTPFLTTPMETPLRGSRRTPMRASMRSPMNTILPTQTPMRGSMHTPRRASMRSPMTGTTPMVTPFESPDRSPAVHMVSPMSGKRARHEASISRSNVRASCPSFSFGFSQRGRVTPRTGGLDIAQEIVEDEQDILAPPPSQPRRRAPPKFELPSTISEDRPSEPSQPEPMRRSIHIPEFPGISSSRQRGAPPRLPSQLTSQGLPVNQSIDVNAFGGINGLLRQADVNVTQSVDVSSIPRGPNGAIMRGSIDASTARQLTGEDAAAFMRGNEFFETFEPRSSYRPERRSRARPTRDHVFARPLPKRSPRRPNFLR